MGAEGDARSHEESGAPGMTNGSPSFAELLEERIVLFDGGTGTALYGRGVFLNRCYEELNLDRPELVEEVHRAFLQAGADAIETNTFAANRPRLEQHGLAAKIREINRSGAEAARKAAGRQAFVAGSVGPLGIRLEPWGPTSVDEAVGLFTEQIEGLLEGGIDLLSLETFTDLVEVQAAVRAARELCDLPVIAMMTVDGEGRTPEGVPAEWFARKLEGSGADVVGVNCSVGPAPMLSVIETMSGVVGKPLAAMPNAGMPRGVEGRMQYLTSPVYMGRYAKRFASTGARVIGGCCGVSPEHIRAMSEALVKGATHQAVPRVQVERPTTVPRDPVDRQQRSALARKVARGRFVTAIELLPPRGWEISDLRESVRAASDAGFDAALVVNDPRLSGRMSPMALASLLQALPGVDGGVEPILQYMARDRMLPDVVSDLLGAHALGVRNLMLTTGQAPRPGESAWAVPVFDVDAIGLTNVVTRLNHGLDVGDNPIGEPTAFHAGVMATIGAQWLDEEIRRLEWKVDAGAEYVLTSPVFDAEQLDRFLARAETMRVPVIATVVPLRSLRDAEHMAGEIPGVRVPRGVLDRMGEAGSEEAERETGLAIARELIERVRPLVEGVMLAGPRRLERSAWDVLRDVFGTDVPVRRQFKGHPGIKGGSEGSRYDRPKPASS